MSGSSWAIVPNSPIKAHRHPPAHPSKTHTHTRFTRTHSPPPPLKAESPSRLLHAASPHHPTQSCGATFPLEPLSLPPPPTQLSAGREIPDDTLNIRFPIMHLQAPSRFLHHATTSRKQHVAQRNT